MGEEWRLLIELDADGDLAPVARELIAELGPPIGLHRADEGLVAYSDTAAGVAGPEHPLRGALERHALGHLESRVEHWDHEKQEWTTESDSSTKPTDEDEPGSDDEADDSDLEEATPASSWTVAVTTRSHDDAQTLVTELELRAPGADPQVQAD